MQHHHPIAIAGGFLASGAAALVAQFDPTPYTGWLQYGALGILAGTVVGLFWVICRLITGYKELADRWDEWEKVRHADSAKLETTLTALAVNCAQRKP